VGIKFGHFNQNTILLNWVKFKFSNLVAVLMWRKAL